LVLASLNYLCSTPRNKKSYIFPERVQAAKSYSFSLNVMKISAVSILAFGENQNFTDLTGIILVVFFFI